jgi:2-furoyl-CoA dehydrogenase large subunit
MVYITTVLTAAERHKAGAKNGAQATASITLDPVGTITVQVASAPQGQGHRTVLAQVVADALGVSKDDVRVTTDLDTAKDAWSIASGNYSSRFAPAVAGVTHLAAIRLKAKLARIAAAQLNVRAEDLQFAGGKIAARSNPDASLSFARVAAASHWAPGLVPDDASGAIRETAFWTPPELTAPTDADLINSSLCHGFIFDFCGVEIDRVTGRVRIDRYVTTHDCGRVLHPGMVDGQIRGGFAQGLGGALFEELSYGDDGTFLAGTFADYLLPTATEVPDPEIRHIESPSPFTPLGAKGVGEGNCMSTPVCVANAVADALGVDAIDLPLTLAKLAALAAGAEPPPPEGEKRPAQAAKPGDRTLRGSGEARIQAPPEAVWKMLLDADLLASIIPGAHGVQKLTATHFKATVTLGVGPVKGRYGADIELSDLDEPRGATLTGSVDGALGSGGGTGRITLASDGQGGTVVSYTYQANVGGKVAAVGGRLLDGAARVIIGQFFKALARKTGGGGGGVVARVLTILRLRR